MTSLTLSTASTPAQQLSTFIACAGSSGSTYCVLPALPTGNYYTLMQSQTVTVNHRPVTISGGSSNRNQTVLLRDLADTSPMMEVNAPVCVDAQHHPENCGITIQYLTFCGNGNLANQGLTSGSGCPALPVPPNQATCTTTTNACNDLKVDNVDTGIYPTPPFDVLNPSTSVYAGPFSLIVSNCDFEDSTGNAISMFATSGKINDVWIHDTAVNYSAVTGILIDTNVTDFDNVLELDRKVCDAWASSHPKSWADDSSLFLPRNIRIGDTNTFTGNLLGSVAESGRWIAVRNNKFTNNYITSNKHSAGGTMTFDDCADTVEIYNNQITGALTPASALDVGLELYGRNIYVLNNPLISGYPWAGIAAASTYNLFIENNPSITDNSTQNTTGGVLIETLDAPGCNQRPRDTQGVTISSNGITAGASQQPDGVKFGDRARNTINGVSMSSNAFSSYSLGAPIYIDNPIVVVSGTVNGNPCPGLSCGSTGLITSVNSVPRALAPDAVSPVTFRCPAPGKGNVHETAFNFEGSDVLGPGNVQDLEVEMSITQPPLTTPPTPPSPDTGAHGCHFVFTPYSYSIVNGKEVATLVNLLYLAAADGTKWGAGPPTAIGAGGTNLTNGYCTVHGATSSTSLTQDSYILNLTLDIDFQDTVNKPPIGSISQAYIFVVVTNHSQQLVSNGGTWTYYGWWSQP